MFPEFISREILVLGEYDAEEKQRKQNSHGTGQRSETLRDHQVNQFEMERFLRESLPFIA